MAVGDVYELRFRMVQGGVTGSSSFFYEQTGVPPNNEKFSANLCRAFYSVNDGVEAFLRPILTTDTAVPVCQAAKVYDPSNTGDDVNTEFDDTFIGNQSGSYPPAMALPIWQTGLAVGNAKFSARASYLMGFWDQIAEGPYCTELANAIVDAASTILKTPKAALDPANYWRLVVPERSTAVNSKGQIIGMQTCDLVFPGLWPTNIGSRQAGIL